MAADETAVLEANRLFYHALTEMDLHTMEQIWLHEPWVSCLHPGWQMLTGWEEVLESWKQIFIHTESHEVTPTNESARLFGDLGWVLCLERIVTRPESGGGVSFAQGTNLFVRAPSGWKLVLHHASIVPVEVPPTADTTIH